jgi:stage II sporulation protein D
MNRRPRNAFSRWAETADLPAMAAALVSAFMVAVLASSCTSQRRTQPSLPGRSGQVSEPQATPPAASTRPASPAPDLRTQAGEPIVRIRIAQSVQEAQVSSTGSFSAQPQGRPERLKTFQGPVTLRRESTGWVVRGAPSVFEVFGDAASSPETLLLRPDAGGTLSLDGKPFPGELLLVPRAAPTPAATTATTAAAAASTTAPSSQWRYDVVELVSIEEYLPGVVAKEMLPRWSLEAYKAQAIAARSYALHERDRSKADSSFDLEASELDQAYAGVAENPLVLRAVRDTRGVSLTWNGGVLRAYYSSTCGGRPSAARAVWPTTNGFEFNLSAPIQGDQGPEVDCQLSPRYRWTVTRTTADLVKRFAAYGAHSGLSIRAIKSIARVTPATTSPDGRPLTYTISDTSGATYTLSAEELRNACNFVGTSGQPPVTAQTRVFSGDIDFAFSGPNATITGRGFGHGVGMCQYGAEGMSRRGRTAEQILMHYYPGATLQKLY